MKVYFIGAGPGAPDLITLRGHKLVSACPYCLYAGSLVPEEVVNTAPDDAVVMDTASMTLEEIMIVIEEAKTKGVDVARVHSGDPSLYGAIAEQIRVLKQKSIAYEIVPGVPAYAAAAAKLGRELTIPKINQSVILTRTAMKSSSMPGGEDLEIFAKSGATLAIHLSVRNVRDVQRKLIPYYGEDCPTVLAYRVEWPDEKIIQTTLGELHDVIREQKITRTGLIMVGRALADDHEFEDSALYDGAHAHILRPKRKKDKKTFNEGTG